MSILLITCTSGWRSVRNGWLKCSTGSIAGKCRRTAGLGPRWKGRNQDLVTKLPVTERIRMLRESVDAKFRWISFEPLIGDVGDVDLTGIHWAMSVANPVRAPVRCSRNGLGL